MTDVQIRMMLLDYQFNVEIFLSESNFQLILVKGLLTASVEDTLNKYRTQRHWSKYTMLGYFSFVIVIG